MKKYFRALSAVLAFVMLALSFTGCAKISYVTNGAISAMGRIKDGSWLEKPRRVLKFPKMSL